MSSDTDTGCAGCRWVYKTKEDSTPSIVLDKVSELSIYGNVEFQVYRNFERVFLSIP